MNDQQLVAFRRDLHQHPELSGEEERTAAKVAEALEGHGFRITTGVAGHGVVADLVGGAEGPTLAFRADMDALPILEENDVPYRSQHEGVMHACGHDAHTTIGVGIARQLAHRQAKLHGCYRFLFQPAEEAAPPAGTVVGAEAMVREGVLEGVDAVFALHCMPSLDAGRIGFTQSGVWASNDLLDIRLTGKTAHAAYPHEGTDAIQMAAALIPGLLAIPSRLTNALTACVLTIGTVRAGTAHNVLAARAELTGILRTVDDPTRKIALAAISRMVEMTAQAYGGKGAVETRLGAAAVHNHPELLKRALERLDTRVDPGNLVAHPSQLGAEDFSAFSARVPGCYLFLGVGSTDRSQNHPIHTPRFDIDESCLPFAVGSMADVLEHLAARWTPLDRASP